jgi:hypothetical protein
VSAFCVEVIVKVLVTVAIYSLFMWDVYFQVMLVKLLGVRTPATPPPTISASGSVSHKYGSGSLSFLIKVLSGLKEWLQNKILIQNFLAKNLF